MKAASSLLRHLLELLPRALNCQRRSLSGKIYKESIETRLLIESTFEFDLYFAKTLNNRIIEGIEGGETNRPIKKLTLPHCVNISTKLHWPWWVGLVRRVLLEILLCTPSQCNPAPPFNLCDKVDLLKVKARKKNESGSEKVKVKLRNKSFFAHLLNEVQPPTPFNLCDRVNLFF